MIGEIGGDAEERAAAFIEKNVTKPVIAYVAGFTAPEGKTMGHAGAIISGSAGTAQAKKEALEKVGVRVGRTPSETARSSGRSCRPALARPRWQPVPGRPPGAPPPCEQPDCQVESCDCCCASAPRRAAIAGVTSARPAPQRPLFVTGAIGRAGGHC